VAVNVGRSGIIAARVSGSALRSLARRDVATLTRTAHQLCAYNLRLPIAACPTPEKVEVSHSPIQIAMMTTKTTMKMIALVLSSILI
jgi:hypothetical protein